MTKGYFVFKAARISILAALFSLLVSFDHPIPNKETVIAQVLKRVKTVKKLSYELKNTERIDGKMLSGEQLIKYQATPFMCRLDMLSPNKGAVLTYKEGENKNKAIYKPNSFPFVTLNLDPLGILARTNNHHTIFELGFSSIATILEEAIENKSYLISLKEDVFWNKMSCYHLVLEAKNTKLVNYVIKRNESLRSIAKDLLINEYKIVELNDKIKNYEHKLIEGQVIKVPSSYANKIDIYINKNSFLPVFQEFKDENGTFARYEYKKVIINPEFNNNEFDLL